MIIGVAGKMGSGKDTIGQIIQYITTPLPFSFPPDYTLQTRINNFGIHLNKSNVVNWKIKKYADKLKDTVCLWTGCTRRQLENRDFKNQLIGPEWTATIYMIIDSDDEILESSFHKEDIYEVSYPYYKDYHHRDVQVVEKRRELTYRLLLQILGTEAGRDIIHPNIWVNALFADYSNPYIHTDMDVEGKLISMGFDYGDSHDFEEDAINEGFRYSPKLDRWSFDEDNIYQSDWIITDVRFPNEVEAIKDRGGIVIRVNRDFPNGHSVYWNDPDEGMSSGKYIVTDVNGDRRWIAQDDNTDIYHHVSTSELTEIWQPHRSEIALDNYSDWDYVIYNEHDIQNLYYQVNQILNKEDIV